MRARTVFLLAIVVSIAGLAAVRALTPLPPLEGRERSTAFTDTEETRLGRAIAPLAEAHPGTSGIHALAGAHDAFAARMLLAETAERSLDVQYYIWRNDNTGTLLFEALHAAADRGVRVRLLLDDNNTFGMDGVLAALDSHPAIEIRLFNPFVLRGARWLGYLTDFSRLNRRMHSKSFTADNQATIVGGRNVGDEYFDAAPEGELVFSDLDVLAVGPIVREVSSEFDHYWASGSAYPASRVLPPADPRGLGALRERAARTKHDPAAAEYTRAALESPFVAQLLEGRLSLEWAPTTMVSDDPAKGLGQAPPDGLITSEMRRAIGDPQSSLDLVSPYFVPAAAGTKAFAALAARGVKVRILMNSLEATDIDAVHSGYAKRRRSLLEAGIRLYEMQLVPETGAADRRAGPFGSSASSLHAKTFAVDRRRLFVGSFNFDPRSANLNTELGFVIESTALTARLTGLFDDTVPDIAYEVHLAPTGDVYWTARRGNGTVRYDTEPGTTFLQRAAVRVLSWLPIETLL